ncbi:hypothetical protein KY285_001071 [Solanum tuberosum]|nr:hypothetical protein KY285_001071 [Solanum tuberosum]
MNQIAALASTQGNHHPFAIDKTIEVASNIHHINASTMDVDKTLKATKEKHWDTIHNRNDIPPNVTIEPSKLTIDLHDNANALEAHSGLVIGTGATKQTIFISSHDSTTPYNPDPPRSGVPCPDYQ